MTNDKGAEHEKAELEGVPFIRTSGGQVYYQQLHVLELIASVRNKAIAEVVPVLEFYADEDGYSTGSFNGDAIVDGGFRAKALLAKLSAEGDAK